MQRSIYGKDSVLVAEQRDAAEKRKKEKDDALKGKGDALSERLGKIADLENEYGKRFAERSAAAEALNRETASSARTSLGGGRGSGAADGLPLLQDPVLANPKAVPTLGDPKGPGYSMTADGAQTIQKNAFAPGEGRKAFDSMRGQGTDTAMWTDKSGQERVMSFTTTPKFIGEEGMSPSQIRAARPGFEQQAANYTKATTMARDMKTQEAQGKLLEGLYERLDQYSAMANGYTVNKVTGTTEPINDPKQVEYAAKMARETLNQINEIRAGSKAPEGGTGTGKPAGGDDFDAMVEEVKKGGAAAGTSGGKGAFEPGSIDNSLRDILDQATFALDDFKRQRGFVPQNEAWTQTPNTAPATAGPTIGGRAGYQPGQSFDPFKAIRDRYAAGRAKMERR